MADLNLKVYSQDGTEVSSLSVSENVFGIEPHQQVMFDAVLVSEANSRQATAKTKKRFEVSGGGKKPWRQKGTGRARQGSTRSPIWVGSGTVFGPTGIQNFKIKHLYPLHLWSRTRPWHSLFSDHSRISRTCLLLSFRRSVSK